MPSHASLQTSGKSRSNPGANGTFWGTLERSQFFRRLSADAKKDLAGRITSRVHAKGSYVMSQGDPGSELFIVRQGKIKLMRCADPDRLFVVALLGPGELFGLASAVDGSRRAYTAMALGDVHLFVLHKDDLCQHVRKFPRTAILLMQEMSARMRMQAETVENLALKNVTVRIVRTLVHLANQDILMDDTGLILRKPPTQRDLAMMVGARRETVSRIMTGLIKDRLAERRGRCLILRFQLLRSCGLAKSLRPSPAGIAVNRIPSSLIKAA